MAADAKILKWHSDCAMPNRIKILREERDWTQEALAERINTTHSTIQRLESGKRELKEKWVRLLSKAFNCHPGELFEPITGAPPGAGGKASAYEARMTPSVRAAWFQVGDTLLESARPSRRRPRQADQSG